MVVVGFVTGLLLWLDGRGACNATTTVVVVVVVAVVADASEGLEAMGAGFFFCSGGGGRSSSRRRRKVKKSSSTSRGSFSGICSSSSSCNSRKCFSCGEAPGVRNGPACFVRNVLLGFCQPKVLVVRLRGLVLLQRADEACSFLSRVDGAAVRGGEGRDARVEFFSLRIEDLALEG